MRQPGRATTYVITFLLGTTLTGGVTAVAAGSGGSAKACETVKHLVVGAVRGKCPTGTTAHAIGATGLRGLQGKAGVGGYSVAYVGLQQVDASTNLTNGFTVVNRILNAPAGRYVGTYQAFAQHSAAGAASVSCHFASDGVFLAPNSLGDIGTGGYGEVTGSAPLTMTEPGEIDLACTSEATSVSIGSATLVAIRVNATIQSS